MRRMNLRPGAPWLIAAAIALMVTGVMAQGGGSGVVAIYEVTEGPPEAGSSGVRRVGSMVTDGGATTVICSNGDCQTGPCTSCHTAAPTTNTAPSRYSAASASRHMSSYFPKAAVTVAANSRVSFGSRSVIMQNGRLVTVDRNGTPQLRMPTGAMLLKTSRPEQLIVYPGSAMPEVVR